MTSPVVLYDACVLYPAPLRDLLLQLALTDLYRAKWSKHIHDEWIRALLQDRPDLKRQQLATTRKHMDSHVRDALVEANPDGHRDLESAELLRTVFGVIQCRNSADNLSG